MRRISGGFDVFTSMDTLEKAAEKACAARHDKSEVALFLSDKDRLLGVLRDSLVEQTFEPSPYRFFHVNENGKDRLIGDSPLYPDRIKDWALALAVESAIDRRFVHHSYGSRKGKGVHLAVSDVFSDIRSDPRLQYAFIGDIRQCFASIPKEGIVSMLPTYLKDPGIIWAFESSVMSYPLPGLVLGSRLSPLLCNMYLNRLDHLLRERHHAHYSYRYMDDYLVLGYSKPWLHRIGSVIESNLDELGLSLKPDRRVVPIRCGIPFLGSVIYRDHIMLRKRTKLKLQSQCRRMAAKLECGIPLDLYDRGVLASYKGVLDHVSGRHLYSTTLGPVIAADAALCNEVRS